MKIIIAPDSFKGTLSTFEVCDIIKSGILNIIPDADIRCIPIADGGEGSVDCLLSACGGQRINMSVSGPFFDKLDSYYAILPDGTAVTELAACSGLPLAGDRKSAADTTTYGLGELIRDAVRRGCRKVIIALGGSSSNDGGCGMAASAGVTFLNEKESFIPIGRTLSDIQKTDISSLPAEFSETEFITMCDVKNPLYGHNGAAYVFAPQKGVKPGEIEMLDAGLMHLSEVIKTDLHKDISELPGSGAAGGTGGGTVAFFGSRLQSGIDTVLDAVDFESLLDTADLVITGEGKLDGQSMGGKAVIGIAERAAKKNVPVIAVVGCTGDGYEEAYKHGVKRVIATACAGKSFDDIVKNAKQYLSDALEKNLTHDTVCDIIAGVKK